MNAPDRPRVPAYTTSFLRDVPLPLEEPMPARVGGYRILRILGQGGMGTVFEAEQEATRRFVALKVIHPHLATPRYRRRFAEEIRTLGKFEHPGIARIHDAGSAPDDRGALRLYFSMELVAGLRLDEHVTRHVAGQGASRQPGTENDLIASLLSSICDAVHHAHQKGVIHCDLKPANILVGADGTPKILDFGIARIIGDEARDTTISVAGDAGGHAGPGGQGGIMGTLCFASPEQAVGDRNRLDVLTDVYGLGAVLYALLTGQPPHRIAGCNLAEAARIARDESPLRVRLVRPDRPVELETIVAKAMAPVPRDRYDSAAAMAADLRRFVERRPIHARPAPWTEVALKWVRRNRVESMAIAVASLAVLAAMAGVGFTLVQLSGALSRVQAAQSDHARTRRALQQAQLSVDERHQHSRAFTESFLPDEIAAGGGCVLLAIDWNEDKGPGQASMGVHPDRMLTLDENGTVVDRFEVPRSWPLWASPCFDVGRRFQDGLGMTREPTTVAALVGNLDVDPARELVRCLMFHERHLHLSVLEIEEVRSVIRSRGAATSTTGQLWSHGDFIDVVWDESRGLLWCLAHSIELPYFATELKGCDSAGCPVGLEVPRLLVALDVSDLCGEAGGEAVGRVLPPLVGDATHPAVKPVWAFTLRPPGSVRDGARRPAAPETLRAGGGPGVVQVQLQAFEPHPDGAEGGGLGTLYVTFRYADSRNEIIASVELGADGTPRGPFQLEPIPNRDVDERARSLIARTDPRAEIVAIDLAAITAARPRAEALLQECRDPSAALRALAARRDLSRPEQDAVVACIDAMTSNWRWLSNSAGAVIEAARVVDRLGAAAEPPMDEATLADIRTALARIDEARRLHAERCPGDRAHPCACEWLIESRRALALAAVGDWATCLEAAQSAIDSRAALAGDHGPENPGDHALKAMALHALRRQPEALRALAVAEERAVAAAQSETTPSGSAGELAPRLCARARAVVRGP